MSANKLSVHSINPAIESHVKRRSDTIYPRGIWTHVWNYNQRFSSIQKMLENHGYFVYSINWKPRRVCLVYKNRFVIEASYRIRNIVKAKTSSRYIVLWYLLTIRSFPLKSIWVSTQGRFFTRVRQGPRTIDNDLFIFDLSRLCRGGVPQNSQTRFISPGSAES